MVVLICEQEVFRQQGGIGLPFGLQLHGKTLGIIGMGRIGQSTSLNTHSLCLLSAHMRERLCMQSGLLKPCPVVIWKQLLTCSALVEECVVN